MRPMHTIRPNESPRFCKRWTEAENSRTLSIPRDTRFSTLTPLRRSIIRTASETSFRTNEKRLRQPSNPSWTSAPCREPGMYDNLWMKNQALFIIRHSMPRSLIHSRLINHLSKFMKGTKSPFTRRACINLVITASLRGRDSLKWF